MPIGGIDGVGARGGDQADAVSALVNLGYRRPEAVAAVAPPLNEDEGEEGG